MALSQVGSENGAPVELYYEDQGSGRSSQPWGGYDYDTFAAEFNRALIDFIG